VDFREIQGRKGRRVTWVKWGLRVLQVLLMVLPDLMENVGKRDRQVQEVHRVSKGKRVCVVIVGLRDCRDRQEKSKPLSYNGVCLMQEI
jgi:hypothetical protein